MPASLAIDAYLDALAAAGPRLLDHALAAGLHADVPTCPTWDVADLLAHQTMVHRWATAQLLGTDPDAVPNQTTIRETVGDLPTYYTEGHEALVAALRAAPDDLEAMTFLKDAPPPRLFWARRQTHETTMHGIDAHAAALGRPPTAAEAGIGTALAVDGLDELLRGFYTRGKSKLYEGADFTLLVTPTDSGRRWLAQVSESLTVAPGDPADVEADAILAGTAAALYLALWNRGDEVTVSGRPDVLAAWRANQRVRWS